MRRRASPWAGRLRSDTPSRVPAFLDRDLLGYEEVWAAAGTPDAVFPLTPAELQRTALAPGGRPEGKPEAADRATAPERLQSSGFGVRRDPTTGGTMIQLTESAAGKVKELLAEEGRADIALRVAVQPGGCSGLRYAMYLDDQLTEKDVAEEQFGVKVVIDKMSVPYLAEAKVDFVDSLEASGFTIDNPVATGSCACGHSFH